MKYARFQEFPSSVLGTIQFSCRGQDMSQLVNWGLETGLLFKDGRKMIVNLLCDNCGVETQKHLYEARKALKQGSRDAYCSKKCCSQHHSTKNTKACVICGKLRKHRHSEVCSDECHQKLRWDKRKKKECPRCKAQFAGWTIYCSPSCADADHSDRMKGAHNSNFSKLGRYSNQFRDMRVIVLERDEFACQACGLVDEKVQRGNRKKSILHAHHIDENSRNNVPENLIMLCESCHRLHHHGKMMSSAQLSDIAVQRTKSMTFKLKNATTSLLMAYLPITA